MELENKRYNTAVKVDDFDEEEVKRLEQMQEKLLDGMNTSMKRFIKHEKDHGWRGKVIWFIYGIIDRLQNVIDRISNNK